MAFRIVHAQARLKRHEERVKEREKEKKANKIQDRPSSHKPSASLQNRTASLALTKDEIRKRMKNMFDSAIARLLNQGSVVLWNGLVPELDPAATRSLWSTSSSQSSTSADFSASTQLTAFSSSSLSSTRSHVPEPDDEDLNISDPDPGEDAYIPTGPCMQIELIEIMMAMKRPMDKTQFLKTLQRDDRWRAISQFEVSDALKALDEAGLIKKVHKEYWALSSK
jgi:hypothetical protein